MRIILISLQLFAVMYSNIIVVDKNGSGQFENIQSAINYANDGDTIYVMNGEYSNRLLIYKELSIIGESNQMTIIDTSVAIRSKKDFYMSNIQIRGRNPYNANNGLQVDVFIYDYLDTGSIPNTMIENCVFQGISNNFQGITLGVLDYFIVIDSLRERLENSIFIKNCSFKDLKYGIAMYTAAIIGKKSRQETVPVHKVKINAEMNYYNTRDSIQISQTVIDYRHTDFIFDTTLAENYSYFDYYPFALDTTQIDSSLNQIAGINNNIFCNCTYSLYGGLIWDRYTEIGELNENLIANQEINVYPNPFNSTINIDFSQKTSEPYIINVYNVLGQIVYSEIVRNKNTAIHRVKIPGISSGVYFLSISYREQYSIKKITYLK